MEQIITYALPNCDHQMSAVCISGQDYYHAPETRMWYRIESVEELIAAINDEDADAYSLWCADEPAEEITEARHGDLWRMLDEYRSAKGGAA